LGGADGNEFGKASATDIENAWDINDSAVVEPEGRQGHLMEVDNPVEILNQGADTSKGDLDLGDDAVNDNCSGKDLDGGTEEGEIREGMDNSNEGPMTGLEGTNSEASNVNHPMQITNHTTQPYTYGRFATNNPTTPTTFVDQNPDVAPMEPLSAPSPIFPSIIRYHSVDPPAGMLTSGFHISPPSSQPTIPSPSPNPNRRLLAVPPHSADTHMGPVTQSRSRSCSHSPTFQQPT